MSIIGTLASIVAAIAAIAALVWSISNSKYRVTKRIEKKQAEIRRLEDLKC